MAQTLRCAIYTRKSSEEGLEQGFNSLDAQREACAAYVLSQAGEGWTLLPGVYDDGGFSGGSLERPGVQALIADIRAGRIDVIVVYKVDRLTRSLADFARLVELFDQHGVSFVSVTQAFNTTTSMGRLTLNVLLSFAQFEREVTGERIRDKIAASKAKGMWMGGRPPLGYDGLDRKLVINPREAQVVRHIFDRYLELGSVTALQPDLKARGVRSKVWDNRQGETVGGSEFSRGALYHLLANPVYRGAIRHKERLYPDAHPAIIDEPVWTAVQSRLCANCPDPPETPRVTHGALLKGRVFDDRGGAMSAIHTKRGAKRYRYYTAVAQRRGDPVGSLPRIACGVLEGFLVERLGPALAAGWKPDAEPASRVAEAIERVSLGADRIEIMLAAASLEHRVRIAGATIEVAEPATRVSFAIRLKHRQGAVLIAAEGGDVDATPRIDRALVRAVSLAKRWSEQLAAGEASSLKALALAQGLCSHYAARLVQLAWLAPDLTQAILEGRQSPAVSLGALTRAPLPVDWDEQRAIFARIGSWGAA